MSFTGEPHMTKGTLAGWQEMRCDDEGGGKSFPRASWLVRGLPKLVLAVVAGLLGAGACADTADKSDALPGTEVATAALALTGTGISAQLALTADWNEGYVAQITITNPTSVATSTWQLELELNDSLAVPTPWNGTLSGTSGRVMVTPAPYNHTIYPYSSIVVGFQAVKTGPNYQPSIVGVTRDGSAGAGGSGSGQGGSGSSGTAGTSGASGAFGAAGAHDGGDGGAAGEGDAGGTPSTPSAGAGGSGASPTNIALDRPSTASSAQSGHAAHDGNDGSDDTRWCAASGASPEWWQVDLEGLYALSGSRITWEFSGRPYGYTLSVSQDGLDFTEVVDKRGYLGTEQVRADTFEATARYVRLTVTDLVSNPVTWASMKEFELYGSPLASGGGGAPGSGGTTGDTAGTGAGATSSTGAVTGEGGSTPGSGGSATESGGAAGTSGSGGAAGSTSDTEVEFFFKLPAWVRREQVVFATTGGDLRLNDGVKSGLADVSSVDGGKVSRLGVEATVGNLWSDGPVVLANRAVVHGSATSGSTIEVAPEAHIGGDRREHHDLGGLARVAWTVQFPATSGPTEFLQPGESRALPPGHYPHIVVNQNAHLQLTSGTYTFEGLTVEAGGFIDIDNTAQMVLLYVKNDMTFRGAMTRIVDRANVLFGLAGSGTQIVGGAFRGLLVAPYGTVVMGSDNDGHRGSFFAKAIEAHQWTPISHEPWTHDGLCGANAPCSALCPCEIGDSGCTDETDCVEGASCGTDGVCECADRCDDHGCADASRNRCGEYCPSRCDLGEPGCRADADCSEGTICGIGVGERFGFSDEENVCWTFECSIHDPAHPSDAELNQDCGILPACTPRCDAGDTGPDGCGSFCGDCSSGEIRGPAGRCIAAEASMLRYSPSGAPASSREPATTVESGAVSGKFAVNDRGQATYAIPIEVPPGVKGVQPTLSLMYTSNKTDGILGMGWSLAGISTISRCQQILDRDGQMDPVRLTDTDRLCLDGKEISELQETDPSIRLTETYHGFTLESGNGRVAYYEPVLEVFLEKRRETVPRLWGVTRVVDHGNTIDIAYRTPVSTGTTVEGANDAELLPESITYANSSVTFEYEPRNAPLIRWVSGVRTISMSRLKAINTFVGTVPVKRIEISYFDWGSALPNLVESITECAFDELGTKICKDAPTKFDYNERIGPGEVIGEQEVSVDAYPRLTDYGASAVWTPPVFFVGDFDGDGDQDAVFEGAELWNEDGAFRLEPSSSVYQEQMAVVTWNDSLMQYRLYGGGGFWIDQDGDGSDELVEQQSVKIWVTGVYGQCEPGNCYVGVYTAVRIDGDFLRDPVDLDGDGDVEFAYRGETDDYRDYRTMWADLNGDGLKDAVNINAANDRLEVLINRGLDPDPGLVFVSGDGTEAPGSLLVFSPAGTVLCPNGVCDIDRTPFDFDGDGSEEIQLGQAEPGPAPAQFLDLNGFGKAVIRNDIPGGYHRHEVLGPDLDNDGNPELFAFTLLCNGSEVESEEDCPEPSERSVRIGYRKGPDIARSFLMTGVTDGLGKRTSWRYDTERRIEGYPEEVVKTYTRSEHCTPGSRCQTPCLGAGKVGPLVSEHTETQLNPRAKSETLGPIVQYRYTYKDGRRGNSGRKWFSFAERTIEGPTSKTTIEYINNSLDYDAMRGVTGGEIFKFAGKVKSVTTESILEGRAIYHDDTSVPLVSTVDWAKYRWDLHPNGFPYLMSQYTSYSENDEVLKWTYTGREVDDYGNELSSETTTTVDGRSSTDSVVRTFQNWTGDKWRIGLVDTEVRESSRNAGLPKTRTTAFTYNADGDVMTVAREPEEASSQSGAFQLTTLEYTMRGNIGLICTTDDSSDPCKRFVEVTDWSPGEVFPVVVENALGERLEMAHDARTGQVVWAYDGAGRLVQESEYDAFGRVVFRSTPSSEIEVRYTGSVQWFDESSGGSEGLTGAAQVIVHQVGEGDSSVLLDGRGRVLARRKVGFRSAILQEEMYYDQIGRLIGFSQPHSIAAGAMSQGSTTIDYNGARVVAITGPDGGVTEYSYPSRVTALGSVSEWFDANAGLINGVVTHHPRGNVSAKFVDAFGATALTAQGELGTPDLARVEFGFGPFGVLERVVAPGGTTELGTDVLGRVVSVDDPGAGYRSVTYNGFDEITSVLDGRGELTRFEYDQVGRPSTKKDGNGATIARWIHGAAESPEPGRPVAVFRQDAPGSTTGTWTRYQYQASTETSNRALLARIEYGFNGNVDTVDSGEALAVEFEYGAEVPWRVSTVNYPSSAGEPFSVLYDFDRSSGIMASVRPGDSPSHAFWELEEVEDGMRPKQEGYGDGTVTVLDYFGIEDQGRRAARLIRAARASRERSRGSGPRSGQGRPLHSSISSTPMTETGTCRESTTAVRATSTPTTCSSGWWPRPEVPWPTTRQGRAKPRPSPMIWQGGS
jgi:YD repeat-containing protein